MSTIFVSVGQCGNQLSKTLLDQLLINQSSQTSNLYNNFDGKFHFVNLDSEAKVIKNLYNEHKQNLRAENLINTKCGRGSNWASGYTGLQKDGSLQIIEKSLESIRRESERCDYLISLIMMHSLSGGTGSGCGSKLIEQLRDEFGWKKLIYTQSVAPFRDGELPLQHYNNLLCLSHLQEYADFVGLYQNDDVLDIISKTLSEKNRPSNPSIASKTGLQPFNSAKLIKKESDDSYTSVTIQDMNNYIVKCLLNSINPVDNISTKSQGFGMELLEIQRFLCPNFNLKIVETYNVSNLNTVKTIYEKSNPLLKKLLYSVPKYKSNTSEYFKSLNSLLIARGPHEFSEYKSEYVLGQLFNDMDLINKTLNPVKWNSFSIDFWTCKNSLNQVENTKAKTNSLTLCTNRNKCCEYLKEVVDKAKLKYSVKAYLHWYQKFNIGKEFFDHSFENLNQIIDAYDQMTL